MFSRQWWCETFQLLLPSCFPLRAETLDDFCETISARAEGDVEIVVFALRSNPGGFFSGRSVVVGSIGTFDYSIRCEVVLSDGRRLTYIEDALFSRFGSDYGVSDANDRENAALQLLITAAERVERIQAALPDADVFVSGRGGSRMPQETLEDAHTQATERGIEAIQIPLCA